MTLIDDFSIKVAHQSFADEVLKTNQITDYVHRSKFHFYFGVNLRLQGWLEKNWQNVDLDTKRGSFTREKINEAVIPELKFLIRKGVPMDMMRQLILNLFGITNYDTKLEYNTAKKQFEETLKEYVSMSPLAGSKVKIDSIVNHHCLNQDGLKVAYVKQVATQDYISDSTKKQFSSVLSLSSSDHISTANIPRMFGHSQSAKTDA